MEEQLISYETAVLANEKGFDLKADWLKLSLLDINNNVVEEFSAAKICLPTQGLLQKWLREIHKIDITMMIRGEQSYEIILHKNRSFQKEHSDIVINPEYNKSTYEVALEEALQRALKLIS